MSLSFVTHEAPLHQLLFCTPSFMHALHKTRWGIWGGDWHFAVEEIGASCTELADGRARNCPLQLSESLLWPRRKGTLFQPAWPRVKNKTKPHWLDSSASGNLEVGPVLAFKEQNCGVLGLRSQWGTLKASTVCWGHLLCQALCQALSVHDLIWFSKQLCKVIVYHGDSDNSPMRKQLAYKERRPRGLRDAQGRATWEWRDFLTLWLLSSWWFLGRRWQRWDPSWVGGIT